jgi:hypothetical protein
MLSAIGAHFMTVQNISFPFTEAQQKQAFDLWAFVCIKIPKFTNESALSVVQNLPPIANESPKKLARRLMKEMAKHGVHLKHTHAIDAASKVLGYKSWHAANQDEGRYRLKVTGFSATEEKLYADWRDLTNTVCDMCSSWALEHQAKVFTISFDQSVILINASPSIKLWPEAKPHDMWPLLAISPLSKDDDWLSGVTNLFEKLRRHLEGAGKALLDGVAVPLFFDNYLRLGNEQLFHVPSMQEVCNSELILLREDNELWPGYEVARGNEFNCWSQLELASKDDSADLNAIVCRDGAWIIGDARYVWQISTLMPLEFVPGLVVRELGHDDAEKLLNRFQLVRKIFKGKLPYRMETKRLNYLSSLEDTYQVNQHRILLELNKIGHTWESYFAGRDEAKFQQELSVSLVFELITELKLEDPNIFFRKPNRSELTELNNDQLLRALLPRVDHVSYRLPRGLNSEIKSEIEEAIADFSTNIRLLKLSLGDNPFFIRNEPFPYLVFASDPEEFRLRLLEMGFVMYVGVMPWLLPTEGIVKLPENAFPFALGHSLYLDIDFEALSSQAA